MQGGRRPGTGGKAGVPNKLTLELRALAEGQPSGGTLLDFLTSVYCNEALPIELRLDAVGKAAPYIHPQKLRRLLLTQVVSLSQKQQGAAQSVSSSLSFLARAFRHPRVLRLDDGGQAVREQRQGRFLGRGIA
jgi:hypothetical protein